MRSIHGRVESISKNARKLARSTSRYPPSVSSMASLMASRRSALSRRTTAAKISAFEPKCA